MNLKNLFALTLIAALFGCKNYAPLSTVNEVDAQKYSGVWYDIVHLPQRFQKGCACVTATYTPLENGNLKVYNRCYKPEKEKWTDITGKAIPVKGANNAKLKVQFFWPFKGDYWILQLDENYEHALVGDPSRKTLWFLSRTPNPDKAVVDEYLNWAKAQGFDVDKMEYTAQENCPKD